ncbi:MAG TPA: FAD-dependent oxidoreductase [Microthrixaceae bacterium]|nr:FAD-dependent oxidoreductase [Microthrixaceae bacterium]
MHSLPRCIRSATGSEQHDVRTSTRHDSRQVPAGGSGDRSGRRRVAVVGSGVAGLTAAHVLQRSHDVTLFEADDRLGGHAHTHDVVTASGGTVAIDTGFIVHNDRTYPSLVRLLDELGVQTQETDMSLSVHCDGCGLEYAGGRGFSGLAPSVGTVVRPAYWRMLAEVRRFHRRARRLLEAPVDGSRDETLGEFLVAGGFSPYFVAHFMTPVVAAVWSASPTLAMRYPARYLFTFLDHHGMLSVGGSPAWRTIVGGSRSYVDRVAKTLTSVLVSTPVRSVMRQPGSSDAPVVVRDAGDDVHSFDGIVVATHPAQALRLLGDATVEERSALCAFEYSVNPTVLHTDASVLPTNHRARASWNYRMPSCRVSPDAVQVSYDMSRLQRLGGPGRFIVSLNSGDSIDPDLIIARMTYEHPQFTSESVAAQRLLPGLRDGVTAFAGAYHGWGFHEDGARSGVDAARSLGGEW